ncbi:MAG: tyrosine--tRNA ligase [Candidatus Nomurabacteria bacterium]|jgi:tyrosyl-tRNA synthetase|nr:tyrosine--tRNA ligase [Candidatus Nomurabacteria bacterium]
MNMKLSEELIWRGFFAEHTLKDPKELDKKSRKFYLGVDPSADSLQIGNLAALMMVRCFARHGYEAFLLVGGATGQIGDPKMSEERQLKSLEEVVRNKKIISRQFKMVAGADFTLVDNYDWFKNINYIEFLREVGKQFSMTQLLDREFVKSRIGEGGVGISYAEFSYSLIQGYDFLHLFRNYGVDLQICGVDQFGNCVSGMHLIDRLAGEKADVWSLPLVIDKITGKKFGKSEGNAVWLAAEKTSVFDFYQFWLNAADKNVEQFIKIYTELDKKTVDEILADFAKNPSARTAQKRLAYEVTKIVHGQKLADNVVKITTLLFGGGKVQDLNQDELNQLALTIPTARIGESLIDILMESGLTGSKTEVRQQLASGTISVNGKKINKDCPIDDLSLIKKGKNKFILVK